MLDMSTISFSECRSTRFEPEVLKAMPNYTPAFESIELVIEDGGEGIYHASLRDCGLGKTERLGLGTYVYDSEDKCGWSRYECAVTDLMERMKSREICLENELARFLVTSHN